MFCSICNLVRVLQYLVWHSPIQRFKIFCKCDLSAPHTGVGLRIEHEEGGEGFGGERGGERTAFDVHVGDARES